ncbi:hypothetical protein Tco_0318400 [Tanacetum coccineum]
MLAPKCATYNGRSTFANPKYLRIAQSEKPCLYEIPYDTSDPANRFCPNGEETVDLGKKEDHFTDLPQITNKQVRNTNVIAPGLLRNCPKHVFTSVTKGKETKAFLDVNALQCPTCKKCLYSANHDECVLEYLSKLNPRASAQIKDAKYHNTTKRYVPVEKTSESKKPERLIPKGHRVLIQ